MDNLPYSPLSDEQRRVLIDATSLNEARESLVREARQYRGGVTWKKVGGAEYLYRTNAAQRQTSLGVRSPETERIYEQFIAGRDAIKTQLATLTARCALQAKYVVANQLGRLPGIAGSVITTMTEHDFAFRVVGTNCLYAFEVLAGVQFIRDATATLDVDLLFDGRRRLRLVNESKGTSKQLLTVLQQADSTFRRVQGFRAVNSSGYMVDMITPQRDARVSNAMTRTAQDDLQLVEIPRLEWLANAPSVKATVFTIAGKAVTFDTIDPRFFAVFKVFLAGEDSRDPVKKPRDLMQATAVATLVNEHLPWLSFADPALKVFPAALRAQASKLFGFEVGPPPEALHRAEPMM